MRVCTFFGHRETPEEVKGKLFSAIEDLMVNPANIRYRNVAYKARQV